MQNFIIHYSEIALKKGNRSFFVNKLVENIKDALKNAEKTKINKLPGLLLLEIGSPTEDVSSILQKIPGIANFFPGFLLKDLKEVKNKLNSELLNHKFKNFRITTQRGDKTFSKTSEDVSRELGAFVVEKTGAKVKLKNSEFIIFVEIIKGGIFLSFKKIKGISGLPVGSSGNVVSLLSGGIDSPVASYMMTKRGCKNIFVHFHSYPYLDYSSQEKAIELTKKLGEYQGKSKLYLLPLGDVQKEIVLLISEEYRIIIYRRIMLRAAEEIAKKEGSKALITGDSVGQVASQTLENISTINSVVNLPVLRPLVGLNKEEIINIAKDIDTYQTSIVKDQD